MNLVQLERRFTSPVHVLTSPALHVPAYVRAYLAKGSKFIPDRKPSTAAHLVRAVDSFERCIQVAAFFKDKQSHTIHASKCRMRSSWSPTYDPWVSLYCRLLKEELIRYQPLPLIKNEDFVDRAARRWLTQNSDLVCVVDADKNLGDAILPKAWVKSEVSRLLAEAAVLIMPEDFTNMSSHIKFALDSFLHRAHVDGLITTKVLKFLLKDFNSNKAGSFRLRVKLHKTPIVGRPIMNLSRTWIAPAATYLTEMLNPAQKRLPHVIESSTDLLKLLGDMQVPDGFVLFTFDVRNLYPSIDRSHFMTVIDRQIKRLWSHDSRLGVFLIRLTEFVLDFQFLQHDDQMFQVTQGLPTGLQTSVIFANMYLAELDEFTVDECKTISLWARFVDDSFGLAPDKDIDEIQNTLHDWHPSIKWDKSGAGEQVSFLDLDISLESGSLRFETYRKPLNSYLYIPRISCHPEGVFDALVVGETQRLYRTCHQNKSALQKHLQIFVQNLRRRGHNKKQVEDMIASTCRKLENARDVQRCRSRKFFFKTLYSSSLNIKSAKAALKRRWHVIQHCFKSKVDASLCHRVQANLFRRDFNIHWPRASKPVSGRGG